MVFAAWRIAARAAPWAPLDDAGRASRVMAAIGAAMTLRDY